MAEPRLMECLQCGHQQPYQGAFTGSCAACQSDWLEAHYDYESFAKDLRRGLPGYPNNLWRYHPVLPVSSATSSDKRLPAGGTPLQRAGRLGSRLNLDALWVKDERFGPTSSFKDRQAAVAVEAFVEAGINEAVIASTGNAAVAYAAACARRDIKLWVFMTSSVPQEKLREAALFGAEVVKVSGSYDQTKKIAAEFAQRRNLILDRGARSLPARESMKTIAYEIVEGLGWKAPDWYIQAVSGGMGPLGVFHGFEELQRMGIIDKVPKLAVVQAEGCAPMVQAFKAGRTTAEAVQPQTLIAILSTGDPGPTYTRLFDLIQRHGGWMESVSDAQAFEAMHTLAKVEGMAVEPAAAVAFAGVEKLARAGAITADELVVINCSGHTFPVEKHVLGERWSVDLDLSDAMQPAPREGLQAALNHIDEQTTRVLLIDDRPEDRLLVRRILEKRKAFRIFEAEDGRQGLEQARSQAPDLIILDLMMPELDGFGLLEALRSDPKTNAIPVIVISAKDLSEVERRWLGIHTDGLVQKGALKPGTFVDQVVEVLEGKRAPEGER